MPKSSFLSRLFCCADPSERAQESELEAEMLLLRAKLAAAEESQQQMAEELSDANAKRSLLAQKIVQVETEYSDFRRSADQFVTPRASRRPLARTGSARRPFTPLVRVHLHDEAEDFDARTPEVYRTTGVYRRESMPTPEPCDRGDENFFPEELLEVKLAPGATFAPRRHSAVCRMASSVLP